MADEHSDGRPRRRLFGRRRSDAMDQFEESTPAEPSAEGPEEPFEAVSEAPVAEDAPAPLAEEAPPVPEPDEESVAERAA